MPGLLEIHDRERMKRSICRRCVASVPKSLASEVDELANSIGVTIGYGNRTKTLPSYRDEALNSAHRPENFNPRNASQVASVNRDEIASLDTPIESFSLRDSCGVFYGTLRMLIIFFLGNLGGGGEKDFRLGCFL